ncbi:alpha-glucosidase/alpha-galactosidase [Curtobacterium sp. MCBD17_040]|uniref:alpha-glucosidase/alpha-galactosidase n=1 Tax=Curtobacterium sp. MCBD17_040 TaxID=2175674 RepID=UPI000DAA1A72|nr:alpha-glucosidase/alpha-galactosidase [Curtobacterium sp. MCBD17_040]WIB64681.1 alpha-glucosidase/alpha-galactosidase [Curtobacterium sp. MCBD17_040]
MTRVTFIGAGSVVFTRQLLTDLLRFPELADVTVALHDIDPDRLAVAEGTAKQVNERLGARATIVASLDRRLALEGSDFVVNMVQIGGIDGTRKDLEIPARYGLQQTIGDTTGVGGVFRGLRTFPFLTALTADMRAVCPDALLMNYTNPMAMNVWWLSVVAPDIRSVGLCHSVYWTAHELCELVGVPLEGTHYRAAGVNHQAWLLEWSRDGEDLYPRLRERIRSEPELQRRVRVEMFERFGFYPTETSEHSSEYLSWFLRSPEQIARYRIEPLQYLDISAANVDEFEDARTRLASGTDLELHDNGAAEYAPLIIHSMVTGTERVIHANVPNRGLIDDLPTGAAVEVPCTIDAGGLAPHRIGNLPLQCAAQNRNYVSVAELAVAAAQTGDPLLVRQAVLVDPNASSTLTPEQIWAMCNDLVDAHGDLLPEPLRVHVPSTWS